MLANLLMLAGRDAPRSPSEPRPARPANPAPPKRPAVRMIARIAVALSLGLAMGASVHFAPFIARDLIAQKLRGVAQKRGFELEIGAIYLDPLSQVVLDDLTLHDRTRRDLPPLARIERIVVRYEVNGISAPKVFLQDVQIEGVKAHLYRDTDGRTNLDGALQWLTTRGSGEGGAGGGGLRAYLSNHLPSLRIRRMRVAVDDQRGVPLKTPSGLDMRHVRLEDASLELVDESPVREVAQLRLVGRTRIEGLVEGLEVHGELTWPGREGWLKMAIPDALQVEAAGFRVGLDRIELRSDGRVVVGGLRAERLASASGNPLALQVREVEVKLSERAAAASVLPDSLRKRLPAPVLTVLRHVEEVAVHEPVLAGRRPATQEDAPEEQGGKPGARRFSRRKMRRLLPRASRRVDAEAVESGKKKKKKKKRSAARKAAAKGKPVETRDGSKVRDALVRLLSAAADRLDRNLVNLRHFIAAQPVRLVTVHHGRARYRDERLDSASSGEVSDFNARIERSAKDGMVSINLDFDVPGRKVDNRISGRVDPKTGDTQLRLHIDRLPLAPYAALSPASLTVHGDSTIHDTRVRLRYDAAGRKIGLDGKAAVSRIDVEAPRISRHLIADLSATVQGRLQLDLERDRLSFEEGELTIGKVRIRADGAIANYRKAPAFDLHIKVPTVDCQDAVDALVDPFAPMLSGMRCSGTLSFRVELSLDTGDMKSLKFEFDPMLRNIKILRLGRYINFDVLNMPFEHHARQVDDTLYTFITGPGSERWVDLHEIAENLTKVVNTTEDGTFWVHNGFSINQIRRAMVANLRRGRFVRGASTISQQAVKNLFFVEREKTLSRKVQEAVITWEMERTLEKEQILALYFNIIEFGPRIYGIRAAANHYFNRQPKDLTLLQTLWLGSIIPGPRRWYHHFTEGKVSEVRRKHLCWLGNAMLKREKITASERNRLGDCNVVFGAGQDGSEKPMPIEPLDGLGHGSAWPNEPGALPPPGQPEPGLPVPGADGAAVQPRLDAPSVAPEDQP